MKQRSTTRQFFTWFGLAFAVLIALVMIGQAMGVIPTTEEMRMTEAAVARVRIVATSNPTSDEGETRLVTPSLEGVNVALVVTQETAVPDTDFVVEQVIILDEADGKTPDEGVFLVLVGTLYNNTSREKCVRASDSRLYVDGEEYRPPNDVMDAVKVEIGINFMGAYAGQCVDGGESEESFIAFDVPENIIHAEYQFEGRARDVDITPPPPTATSTPIYTPTATDTATITLTPSETYTPTITLTPSITNTRTAAPRLGTAQNQFTRGTANVRSCPNTSCDIATTLSGGAAITTYGTVDGERVSGSNAWWMIQHDGEIVYIHSSLVTGIQPIAPATSAPGGSTGGGGNWTCAGDIYNCADFATCGEAMDYFTACPGDPSDLDGDKNGVPCKNLCGR